jgi:hypothetical protein
MAAIVLAGSPPLLVRYESWDAWRADITQPLPPAPLIAPSTASCSRCWGQGRVWAPARNGEGLIPQACEACDGSGLVFTGPPA